MTPVIYADTLFLYNFLIDSVILFITSELIKCRINLFRIVLGAVLGGVYSVFMFFPSVGILYSVILKGFILFGIFYLVFGGDSIYKTIKNFIVFMAVNLMLGGCVFALVFLTDFGTAIGSVVSGGEVYMNISPLILFFGIVATYIIFGIFRKVRLRVAYEKSLIKRVVVEYKGKSAEINMFYDTGCRLRDPVTDRPAVLVEYRYIKMLLSEEERTVVEENNEAGEAYMQGMRVLPLSTVNGENRVFGIVADVVSWEDFKAEKVTIGLIKSKINENYNGIINPEIVIENMNTEDFAV